ncbi:MAG TPA: glycolate oxidase subunit GlcF [Thiobacillus sp.]|nr:MAG: glycolate oxidase iron-sulfur subunit [Hydrogenophilales bacterium 28-61-11]OYZ56649.1 MAG: glycolate oxidase iron-sulfur subunit [Hydrogenophilales bacterium 16-61-112]OZA50134.1 MAG: glycolate oxidase iron-sulfur subunit [Hydrogenophilales bacterium 17-61-76]HQT30469.1 glycolate oxidase subunit GlcF [Thiobacillus sp.]HQT68919.1 glycolate oxidase subunit GlcF [Thiobacillus sp.]
MQTTLADTFRNTPEGDLAESILRSCVHCGFCLATCPTYQLLGNELDSPRGRIYLIKQVFEGATPTAKTQLHLDRCLTCRNCETTCPSGVEYGKLIDLGRALVEKTVGRGVRDTATRAALKTGLLSPVLFNSALKLGQSVRSVMPEFLRSKIPASEAAGVWPAPHHARQMLVLQGCVQPGLKPNINAATARVLDRLGISLIAADKAGCCGAVAHHLNDHDDGLNAMRRNIDAWLPHLDAGAEAIVMTASGCGVMVKDYGWQLRDDPTYADKAARVSAATQDISEVLLAEREAFKRLLASRSPLPKKVAYHPPCTLQHGQKLSGGVEGLLVDAGFELTAVAEKNLCCGSAGTYSILQPEIAGQLKTRKLGHLEAGAPEVIVTANIGCLTHLQSGTSTPVRHWVELLDEALGAAAP